MKKYVSECSVHKRCGFYLIFKVLPKSYQRCYVGTIWRDRWSRGREGDPFLRSCHFVDERLEESVHNILPVQLVLITRQEMSSVRSRGGFLFRLGASGASLGGSDSSSAWKWPHGQLVQLSELGQHNSPRCGHTACAVASIYEVHSVCLTFCPLVLISKIIQSKIIANAVMWNV